MQSEGRCHCIRFIVLGSEVDLGFLLQVPINLVVRGPEQSSRMHEFVSDEVIILSEVYLVGEISKYSERFDLHAC